jgi:hypothetical protein
MLLDARQAFSVLNGKRQGEGGTLASANYIIQYFV